MSRLTERQRYAVESVMPFHTAEDARAHRDLEFSEQETALYSKDMLDALRSIAVRQQHHRLAELLAAAGSRG
jgi:hypothetical protein